MPSLPPLVDRTRLAPAATRVSPTSWPLTPVAETGRVAKAPTRPHSRWTATIRRRRLATAAAGTPARHTTEDHRAMSRICCQEDTAYPFAMRQRVRKPRCPPRFGQCSRAPSSFWRVAPATPHTAIHSGRLRPVRYPIGASAARGGCHLAGRVWIAAPQLDLRFGGAGCRCLLGRCSARRAPLAGV